MKSQAKPKKELEYLNNIKKTRHNGNLMPFGAFEILFQKSTIAKLHATENKSILLKTYN